VVSNNELQRKHKNTEDSGPTSNIKFVKSKPKEKLLMCHIIALAITLSNQQRMKASVIARALKKEVGELKNYFKEVGLSMEVTKDVKTGEPDLMLYLQAPKKREKEELIPSGEVDSTRDRAKSE
jgi:hypothetical protein